LGGEIKGKATDGFVSRYFNRRISSRLTWLIVKHDVPLTPNQVSLVSFMLALSSFPFFMAGLYPLAGVIVQLSSIIDGVDGELARARGISSPVGGFIDSILDRFADAVIITGLILSSYAELGFSVIAWGLAALLGSLMVSYIHSQGRALLGLHVAKIGKVPMYASRDVRLFIVFLGSILYSPLLTLILLVVLTISYCTLKTIDVYLKYRKESRD